MTKSSINWDISKKEEVKHSEPASANEKKTFSHEQMLEALYFVHDFMDRAMLTFCVVGSTADSIIKNKILDGSSIKVAVRKPEWDSGARVIADAFAMPIEDLGDIVTYEWNGVPITLYILKDSETLQRPDTILYESEYFKFPNPFKTFKEEFPWLI